MELRSSTCAMLVLCGCASTLPKRLVIPEEMRRPLAAQPAPATPAGAGTASSATKMRSAIPDPYGGLGSTDDLTEAKAPTPPPAAPAPPPAPGTAAAPAPATGTAAGKATALPIKPPAPQAQPPIVESQRYTLRLVERGRVWEVELPESTGGYEVRIPLGPGIETPTLADQEMLGKTPPEGKSKSYLATLAKVGEMYSAHRYELALIEVVDLEQQYPKDARLLAMKGSLYQKLGKSALARDAWKKSLEYDPTDATVAEALRSLKEE